MLNKAIHLIFNASSTALAIMPAFFVFLITNRDKSFFTPLRSIAKTIETILDKDISIDYWFMAFLATSLLLMLILSWFWLYIARFLPDSSVGGIQIVEPANDGFLPTYLGYFFVSVSISDPYVFAYFIILLFAFSLFAKIYYFNPSLLLLGYKYYYVTMRTGIKIMLISRREVVKEDRIQTSENFKKINEFTFLEIKYR